MPERPIPATTAIRRRPGRPESTPARGKRYEGPDGSFQRFWRFRATARGPGFRELMGMLDGETRLLTPIDPETADAGIGRHARPAVLPVDARLPGPLTAGMAREEAEIDAERAGRPSAWPTARQCGAARPESRQLPSLREWIFIGLWTPPASRTPLERKLMRAAGRYYMLRMTLGVLLVLVFFAAGLEVMGPAGSLLMRFRARSAAVWMAVGNGLEQAVWPLLKHSPDPTLRTQVIHGVGPIATDPQFSWRPSTARKTSPSAAMVLMAGELAGDPEDRPAARAGLQRTPLAQPLLEKLLDLYRNDPDPGLHAAAEWTLRRSLQAAEIDRIDRQVAQKGIHGDFGWYVNTHGHTMMVIPGPAQFLMGSPGDGSQRTEQRRHSRRIRGSFSIAAKETTAEQFRAFLADNPAVDSEPGGPGEAAPGVPGLRSPGTRRRRTAIGLAWPRACPRTSAVNAPRGGTLRPGDETGPRLARAPRLPAADRSRMGIRLPRGGGLDVLLRRRRFLSPPLRGLRRGGRGPAAGVRDEEAERFRPLRHVRQRGRMVPGSLRPVPRHGGRGGDRRPRPRPQQSPIATPAWSAAALPRHGRRAPLGLAGQESALPTPRYDRVPRCAGVSVGSARKCLSPFAVFVWT